MSKSDEERQENLDFLAKYGWSEEKADAFMTSKIMYQVVEVPGKILTETLEALTKEGIPARASVVFMIPVDNKDAFMAAAKAVADAAGGNTMTAAERDAFAGLDPTKIN